MRRFLALALLLVPSWAWAAELKLLGEAREHRFATVESDKEGPWLVFGPNAAVVLESKTLAGTPVLGTPKPNLADSFPINGTKGVKFVGAPGWYVATQWPPGDEQASYLVIEILPAKDRPVVIDPVDPDKPPPVTPSTATSATYIYEKDETGVPPTPVLVGLDKINQEKKIVATTFEDPTNSTGQVPAKLKTALAAARAAGLPALVVMSGGDLLRVVKDPKTVAQVLDAVK